MRAGISLTELATRIEAEKASKIDMIADSRETRMVIEDNKPRLTIEGAGDFGIKSLAHQQIASRLSIPQKYYDRMADEAPDLLIQNVNEWFERYPERRMVRTLSGDVRAYLSDRYNRIDNAEIAEVALPVLAQIPDVKIVSSELTERRMYIQAVSPRVEGEVKKGDIVQAGVVISNSEVGAGSVSVRAMLYRLVCLNGMIIPDSGMKAYHVGRQIEDTSALWQDDTRKADDRAVLLKVRDMVAAAVDQIKFSERIDTMRALADGRPAENPVKAVEVLGKKIGATEGETNSILNALIKGGDLSAWGMINAVTAQAHTATDYDRVVEFEAAGGQLLDLAPTEWNRIMEAA